jgi:pantothenate kinase
MGCTGGGAHKYAKEFAERLDITLQQTDEFSSLIRECILH